MNVWERRFQQKHERRRATADEKAAELREKGLQPPKTGRPVDADFEEAVLNQVILTEITEKNDKEIEQFFVANFASCDDPQRLYMADIVKNGEKTFTAWQKRNQSLTYIFKNEVEELFDDKNFDAMFYIDGNRHPDILKAFLRGNVSIETLIILEKILGYKSRFDKKLTDPVWELISYRINKYAPFLNIDVFRYKKILKETIL